MSVLWVVLGASAALADVDARAAVPVLLKTLSYDTNFDARGAGEFTVLVLAPASLSKERERLMTQLKDAGLKLKSRPVKFVSADWKDEATLQSDIDRNKAAALLPIPELPMPMVRALWEVAQDNQLYAVALTEQMVEQVLPVGVTQAGERLQIVINEKASTAVGARFETAVLRTARVLK